MSAHAENTELTEKKNKSHGTVPLTRGPARRYPTLLLVFDIYISG
jgi:hypothetical protein